MGPRSQEVGVSGMRSQEVGVSGTEIPGGWGEGKNCIPNATLSASTRMAVH